MFQTIKMSELESLLATEKVSVIDVREEDEFATGHIDGAENIPLSGFPDNVVSIDPVDKHYVVCVSGGRSSRACSFLSAIGYDVVNVDGGMSAWQGDLI